MPSGLERGSSCEYIVSGSGRSRGGDTASTGMDGAEAAGRAPQVHTLNGPGNLVAANDNFALAA